MAEQMKIRGIEITCYPDKIKIEKTYIKLKITYRKFLY